jgi:hypothetical protein
LRSCDKQVGRRLYNVHQQLLATAVESEDGTTTVQMESDAALSPADRQFAESSAWRSDVSAAAFIRAQGVESKASRDLRGFELTQRANGGDGILMRTLVLDRSYRVQAERVRFQTSDGVHEVRLVQTLLRRVPNRHVPPSTFPHPGGAQAPGAANQRRYPFESGDAAQTDAVAANLEVAVLFELFRQNMDIGQPIEVSQLAGGRILMTGTVTDPRLLAAIREKVATLPNASGVDFQIYSARQAASAAPHGKTLRQEIVGAGSDAPATGMVRDALLARGLKGAALQSAEQEFRASTLSHAQAALQHAYALDRLGTILRRNGESSLNLDARVQWARMVERHSTAAVTELEVLRLQLNSISAGIPGLSSVDTHGIADATAFARTSSDLRAKAQSVNEEVVKLFAGSVASLPDAQVRDSIARLCATLPLGEANRMRLFAGRLTNREQNDVGEMHRR